MLKIPNYTIMNKTDLFEAVIELLKREALSLRQFQHQLIRYQYNKRWEETQVQRHALIATADDLGVGETSIRDILKKKTP